MRSISYSFSNVFRRLDDLRFFFVTLAGCLEFDVEAGFRTWVRVRVGRV